MKKKVLQIVLLLSVSSCLATDDAMSNDQNQDIMQPEGCYAALQKEVVEPMQMIENSNEAMNNEQQEMQDIAEEDNQMPVGEMEGPNTDMMSNDQTTVEDQTMPADSSVGLHDFSQQFVGQCPEAIDQTVWNEQLLLPLQMIVDNQQVAGTKEEIESMLHTIGQQCMNQGQAFINALPPLDTDVVAGITDAVNQVCTAYIKQLSDAVVIQELDNGQVDEVNQIINDLHNQSMNTDDQSMQDTTGEMEA